MNNFQALSVFCVCVCVRGGRVVNPQYEEPFGQTSCFQWGTKSVKKYLTLSHGTLCQESLGTSLRFLSIYKIREKVNLVQFLLLAPATLPIQACEQIKYHDIYTQRDCHQKTHPRVCLWQYF